MRSLLEISNNARGVLPARPSSPEVYFGQHCDLSSLYLGASVTQPMLSIAHVALVVKDYDEAIDFFCRRLGFSLVEDTYQTEQDKRWVVVAPPGSTGTSLLLARASTPGQCTFIGRQSGGRVFLFLRTDNFWRDYNNMITVGIRFVRTPKSESYGTVAVFEDLYGNLWDLIGPDKT